MKRWSGRKSLYLENQVAGACPPPSRSRTGPSSLDTLSGHLSRTRFQVPYLPHADPPLHRPIVSQTQMRPAGGVETTREAINKLGHDGSKRPHASLNYLTPRAFRLYQK